MCRHYGRLICGSGPRLLWGGGLVTWLQPLNVQKQRAVVPCYYISTMCYCSTFQSQYSDSLVDGDFVHTDPSRIHWNHVKYDVTLLMFSHVHYVVLGRMLAPYHSPSLHGSYQALPRRDAGSQANSLHGQDADGFAFANPIVRQAVSWEIQEDIHAHSTIHKDEMGNGVLCCSASDGSQGGMSVFAWGDIEWRSGHWYVQEAETTCHRSLLLEGRCRIWNSLQNNQFALTCLLIGNEGLRRKMFIEFATYITRNRNAKTAAFEHTSLSFDDFEDTMMKPSELWTLCDDSDYSHIKHLLSAVHRNPAGASGGERNHKSAKHVHSQLCAQLSAVKVETGTAIHFNAKQLQRQITTTRDSRFCKCLRHLGAAFLGDAEDDVAEIIPEEGGENVLPEFAYHRICI